MKHSKRALVVDDTRMIRAMAEAILRGGGYEVRGAASGTEAQDIWNEWTPDVVLLDLVLADESGWDVYDLLRESPAREATVFLCTGDEEVDDREAIERGAAGVIRKPFTADGLIAQIENALPARS